MELRSGRRLCSPPPPPCGARPKRQLSIPGGADRLSSLHDDILLQVLVHLRSPQDAARASLLSRRWRGLWTGLRHYIFHGVAAGQIARTLANLKAAALGQAVSLIDIHLPITTDEFARANALLSAAARLSPAGLVFTLPSPRLGRNERSFSCSSLDLPCFHRAASMKLDTQLLRLAPPSSGKFRALERLDIAGNIVDVGALVRRCPRLRVLRVTFRGAGLGELEQAIASLEATALGHQHEVSLLGMDIPKRESIDAARITSLLCSAARLSPGELVFILRPTFTRPDVIELPCFHRATSIKLDMQRLSLASPPSGEFPALERLDIAGNIVDVGALVCRCPRLRVLRATFRGVVLRSLEAALASLEAAALGHEVSLVCLLAINMQDLERVDDARITSLLRSAARLSPGELVFIVQWSWIRPGVIELPCFHRATSIEVDILDLGLTLTMPPASEFPALEKLSLSASTVDIGTLLDRCPRLRVLKVKKSTAFPRVHSASLQELDVDADGDMNCQGIDVVTPLLKQLTLKVKASMDLSISILAPMVKKVSWQCSYQGWLAAVSMDMCAYDHHLDAEELNTADEEETEKLPILEQHVKAMGHEFRSILLHLLALVQISSTTATKTIKLVLQKNSQVAQLLPCLGGTNSSCDMNNNKEDLNTMIAGVANLLEELEMEGFQGDDDSEFEFLKLIVAGSRTKLKRVTLKLSPKLKQDDYDVAGGCRDKLIDSFSALRRPSVTTYHVYLTSAAGRLVLHSCPQCSSCRHH